MEDEADPSKMAELQVNQPLSKKDDAVVTNRDLNLSLGHAVFRRNGKAALPTSSLIA